MTFLVIILLLVVGLALILVEALVPGGIIGIIGSVLILFSAYLCFAEYGMAAGIVYLLISVPIAVAAGAVAFFYAVRKMSIGAYSSTQPDAKPEDTMVGMEGAVLVDLDPTGFVRIDGKRMQARALYSEEEIPEGTPIVVVDRDSTYLVVKRMDAPEVSDSEKSE
ncbi:MAG: NfeD family protein [Candidatus Sumerlaeia bacterium]